MELFKMDQPDFRLEISVVQLHCTGLRGGTNLCRLCWLLVVTTLHLNTVIRLAGVPSSASAFQGNIFLFSFIRSEQENAFSCAFCSDKTAWQYPDVWLRECCLLSVGRSELWGGRQLDGLHGGGSGCVDHHDPEPEPLDRHNAANQN